MNIKRLIIFRKSGCLNSLNRT